MRDIDAVSRKCKWERGLFESGDALQICQRCDLPDDEPITGESMTALAQRRGVWLRPAVLAVAVIAVAVAPVFAQENGPKEGIKVHGHWTVDVKNADGSVASHHEFENALVPTGAGAFVRLLAHPGNTVIGWTVVLGGAFTIVSPETLAALPNLIHDSTDLTTTTDATGLQVVLQGSVRALSAASITSVQTLPLIGQTANTATGGTFSERVLAQAISVEATQIVQFTVTFSFS